METAARSRLALAILLIAGAVSAQGEDFKATQVRFFSSATQSVDVELSRFGTYLALADWTEGNSIRVFDENGELLWRHRQPLFWGGTFRHASILQFSPDESFLILPAYRTENDFALVSPRTGEPIAVLADHSGTVECLALSPDGMRLVSGTNDEIFLWKREGNSFAVIDKLTSYAPSISSVAYAPDGMLVAVSESDGMVRRLIAYRVAGDRLEPVFRYENEERNLSRDYEQIAFSPDGRWLAAGYADSLLVFRRANDAFTLAQTVRGIELGPVLSVAFSPDSALLLTGHGRDVRAWRFLNGSWRAAETITPHLGQVRDLEFSEDGTKLAIAGRSEANALGLWSADGVGPSPLGMVVSLLQGRISAAQRGFLDDTLCRRILSALSSADVAPRDMFETEEEYAQRRGRAQTQAARLLQEETERRFSAERTPLAGALYEVSVPLQSQGSYRIDTKTYTFRFMGTEAAVTLERDPARDLYQNWRMARIRAVRVETANGTAYADFRIVLPTTKQQFPVGLSENPFTGEKLDRYGVQVPSIAAGPDLLLRNLVVEGIFPALYRSYANRSLGQVTLQNTGSTTITDLAVRFFVPGLMKSPTDAAVPAALGVGQNVDVSIRALFDASVLERSEGGSVQAELTVEYGAGGKSYKEVVTRPVGILNRNAIRWSDDRRVGAFMVMSDPALLRFSGQVVGMVDDTTTNVLTRSFLSAVRLFAAMQAAGVRYVVDPASSYQSLSRDNTAIDFVRFPVETLDARSGDCDDLSVLYNSLLESVGVSTAFVTTPGHIFSAFDTGMSAELAARLFARPDDLIVRDATAWVPVETTVLDQGFMKAWQTAALEWREGSVRGSAGFFTAHEAWQLYAPAGFSGAQSVSIPARDRVVALFNRELEAYRTATMGQKEAELLGQLEHDPSPALENQLGVLYAQFGLLSKALARFEKAIATGAYLPSMINAANVFGIQKDYGRAQEYLKRALQLEPENARALVALAYAYFQAGNEADAKTTFERMSSIDPALAARYPLLAGLSGPATQARAARAESANELFAADWVSDR